jgi:hypothetical protein
MLYSCVMFKSGVLHSISVLANCTVPDGQREQTLITPTCPEEDDSGESCQNCIMLHKLGASSVTWVSKSV